MPDEKPLSVDGFVDGVKVIKYSDGHSDFDFTIEKTPSGQRVVHKGIAGPEYLRILTGWSSNVMVGGKLGYTAIKQNYRQVMNFDGVEGPEYRQVDCPLVGIDGKLLYIAMKEKGDMVVNFDNCEGKEYSRIFSPSSIAGKPVYVTGMYEKGEDGKFSRKRFIVFDGKEGPKYFNIWSCQREVHGKLAYLAQPEDLGELCYSEGWLLNYDGNEFENRYSQRPTRTLRNWPAATFCFVVDGKEVVEAHAHPNDKIFFDGREVQAPSLVHFLVEYELAKQGEP